MIRGISLISCTAILLITLFGCANNANSPGQETPISTTVNKTVESVILLVPERTLTLFSSLALMAKASNLPYEFEILEVSSPELGTQAVETGQADLLFLMQPPRSDAPLVFYDLLRAPIAIFVNRESGVQNLTRDQAAAIFSSEITNWSHIGGPDLEITVFTQRDDDSNTHVMREYVLGNQLNLSSAEVLFDDKAILNVVGGMPGAIGYTNWVSRQFLELATPGGYPSAVSLDGRAPDGPNYPMQVASGIVFRTESKSLLEPLLDWIGAFVESDTGQTIIKQYGFELGSFAMVDPGSRD